MDGSFFTTTSPTQTVAAACAAGEQAAFWVFAPSVLRAQATCFLTGFPGLVTYAVKANPTPAVIAELAAAGVRGFDVASVAEIELVRAHAPDAVLHFHNPVKSRAEIAAALAAGVTVFAADSQAELDKLMALCPVGTEISVRFRLPGRTQAYDFGSKFGATPAVAADLLRRVVAAGLKPALTFHPGSQCTEVESYTRYIHAAAAIAREAGVRLARLNVGGGFPVDIGSQKVLPLEAYFTAIAAAREAAFGADAPELVCEPGRAMVANAWRLLAQVKLLREDGALFLSDGVYGGLSETLILKLVPEMRFWTAAGVRLDGPCHEVTVFGPTCDPLDRLPGTSAVPVALAEGDWVEFAGLGAYGQSCATRFNGFGPQAVVTVAGF